MIRLKHIYDKYKDSLDEKVEIYDLSNDKTFVQIQSGPYFLGSTAAPMVISILSKTANNIHDLQKKLQIQNHFSIDELVQANNVISQAETASKILVKIDLPYEPCHHAAAKAADAGHKLDRVLFKKIEELGKEFDKKYKQMLEEEHAGKHLRLELSDCLENFKKLKEIYLSRSLPEFRMYFVRRSFADYERKLDRQEKLKKEIGQIIAEYRDINSQEELTKFSKHFKKRARNFLFFKGELIRECIGADYFEGLQDSDKLKKEIKRLSSNFDHHIKIKNSMLEDLAELGNFSSRMNALKNENLSADDLKTLVGTKEKLGKFDHSQAVKTIYLEGLFKQYKSVTNKLYEETSGLLRIESKKLEERQKLEKLKSLKSEYKSIKENFEEISKNVDEVLEQIPSRQKRLSSILIEYEDLTGAELEDAKNLFERIASTMKEYEPLRNKKEGIINDINELRGHYSVQDITKLRELSFDPTKYDEEKDSYLKQAIEDYKKAIVGLEEHIKKAECKLKKEHENILQQENTGINAKFRLNEWLTSSDPIDPDFYKLRDLLTGRFYGGNWTDKFNAIIEIMGKKTQDSKHPRTNKDAEFLKNVVFGINQSMKNGRLKDVTEEYSGRKRQIGIIMDSINTYLGESN